MENQDYTHLSEEDLRRILDQESDVKRRVITQAELDRRASEKAKTRKWSRDQLIGLSAIVLTVFGVIGTFAVVPEVRKWLRLDKLGSAPAAVPAELKRIPSMQTAPPAPSSSPRSTASKESTPKHNPPKVRTSGPDSTERTITQGSGSVASVGQQGGVTAGTVGTVNIVAPLGPCGIDTLGNCLGDDQRRMTYRITRQIQNLYWASEANRRMAEQQMRLNHPDPSSKDWQAEGSILKAENAIVMIHFFEHYREPALKLRNHLSQVAPERLDHSLDFLYAIQSPTVAAPLVRLLSDAAKELNSMVSLVPGNVPEPHDYLGDLSELAVKGARLARSTQCTPDNYKEWIGNVNQISRSMGHSNSLPSCAVLQESQLCYCLESNLTYVDETIRDLGESAP